MDTLRVGARCLCVELFLLCSRRFSKAEEVTQDQLDGFGGLTQTSVENNDGGPSRNNLAATYSVSPNGRSIVAQNGMQIGIIYAISNWQFVFLPTSTSSPKLSDSRY